MKIFLLILLALLVLFVAMALFLAFCVWLLGKCRIGEDLTEMDDFSGIGFKDFEPGE